jgi:hypothetical protein
MTSTNDQVDGMTQFLDWIGRRRGRAKCERRLNGGRPLAPVRPQGGTATSLSEDPQQSPHLPDLAPGVRLAARSTSSIAQAVAECED